MPASEFDTDSPDVVDRIAETLVLVAGDNRGDGDIEYVRHGVDDLISGLRARRAWSEHIGDILTAEQAKQLAGWTTRQALHKAFTDHRVLRLTGSNGEYGYAAATFTDSRPAFPIAGIQPVLRAWAGSDPRGWATASWLTTPQPGLGGRTPRQALLDGDDVPSVERAAQQAADALAA